MNDGPIRLGVALGGGTTRAVSVPSARLSVPVPSLEGVTAASLDLSVTMRGQMAIRVVVNERPYLLTHFRPLNAGADPGRLSQRIPVDFLRTGENTVDLSIDGVLDRVVYPSEFATLDGLILNLYSENPATR